MAVWGETLRKGSKISNPLISGSLLFWTSLFWLGGGGETVLFPLMFRASDRRRNLEEPPKREIAGFDRILCSWFSYRFCMIRTSVHVTAYVVKSFRNPHPKLNPVINPVVETCEPDKSTPSASISTICLQNNPLEEYWCVTYSWTRTISLNKSYQKQSLCSETCKSAL